MVMPPRRGRRTGSMRRYELDFDDIRDETAALLIARRDDAGQAVRPQRFAVDLIGHHDLIDAKIRRDLSGAKSGFISVASGDDDDFFQNVVLDAWIENDANGGQHIPKQHPVKLCDWTLPDAK